MDDSILDELEERIWKRLEMRMQEEKSTRHFSIYQAAEYLGVAHTTVRKLVREKKIKYYRIGSLIFIRQVDLDEWIELMVNGK